MEAPSCSEPLDHEIPANEADWNKSWAGRPGKVDRGGASFRGIANDTTPVTGTALIENSDGASRVCFGSRAEKLIVSISSPDYLRSPIGLSIACWQARLRSSV